MKKLQLLTLNPDSTSKPFTSQTRLSFEDFTIIENYILIHDANSSLLVFKTKSPFIDTIIFQTKIVLKHQKQIKTIDAIDPKNVFLIYHTNEIYILDVEKGTQLEVTILNKTDSTKWNGSSVQIHDKCFLNNSKELIYIGFLSNETKLYLVYKNESDNTKSKFQYNLNCFFIKDFDEELIQIEYKFIKNGEKLTLLLFVLCKRSGYFWSMDVQGDKDWMSFVSDLQKSNLWIKTFQEENIWNYFYSFYFNSDNIDRNSFIIWTENNKCIYWRNVKNDAAMKIELKLNSSSTQGGKIININHVWNKLYLICKGNILEYNWQSSDFAMINDTPLGIPGVLKSYIFEIEHKNFIIMNTSTGLYYYKIGKLGNKKTSNLSMSSWDDNLVNNDKGNKAAITSNTNTNTNNTTTNTNNTNNNNANLLKNDLQVNPASHSNGDDSRLGAEHQEKQQVRLKCKVCGKNAWYQCTNCKEYFTCSNTQTQNDIHRKDWNDHRFKCRRPDYYMNWITEYTPEWEDARRKIVNLIKQRKYPAAIEEAYKLIQENITKLEEYIKNKKILPFSDIEVIMKNQDKLINSFLYYEDYFCNILLLIHIFDLSKSKDEVWRWLNRLIIEMDKYNFTKVTELFVANNPKRIEQGDNTDTFVLEQEIYLRILKMSITIAKYGHSLGEFSFYEKYLIDYVNKIEGVYRNKAEIINNTYLLLGNWYVGYGLLKKGHVLYDAIIENNNVNDKQKLYDVILCANFNSGWINFVIDNYESSKQRLETALKIKRELLKEKNDLQISIIYETLAEIDIEYKNYTSAWVNLQKAIETRELSNNNDPEFQKKAAEWKDYISQNSTDTKTNLNSNLQLKQSGKSTDADNEKFIVNFWSDAPVNVDKTPNIAELEKFFLFMTKLSYDKIKIWNEDQPEDTEKNKYFPIVFSNKFKNSLTHNQRWAWCDWKMTSLTRINILKNYRNPIAIKNLNYNALNLVPPENNLNAIRNWHVTKSIWQHWKYAEDEYEEENEQEEVMSRNEGIEERLSSEQNIDLNSDQPKDQIVNAQQTITSNLQSEETDKDNEEKEISKVDYDYWRDVLVRHCREKAPEKEEYINDKLLYMICHGNMSKNRVHTLIEDPETIDILMDTYIEMQQNGLVNNKDSELFKPGPVSDDDGDDFSRSSKEEEKVESSIPPPPLIPFDQINLLNMYKKK